MYMHYLKNAMSAEERLVTQERDIPSFLANDVIR